MRFKPRKSFIHLIAIAKAAGISFDWHDMADLSEIVPLLCRIYPNGEADVNHFQASGGMGFLMKDCVAGFQDASGGGHAAAAAAKIREGDLEEFKKRLLE